MMREFFKLLRGTLFLAWLGTVLTIWVVVCFAIGIAWKLLTAPTRLARWFAGPPTRKPR